MDDNADMRAYPMRILTGAGHRLPAHRVDSRRQIEAGQLAPVGYVELRERPVQVVADGLRAEEKLRRYLPVRQSGVSQLDDLQLLRRERRE